MGKDAANADTNVTVELNLIANAYQTSQEFLIAISHPKRSGEDISNSFWFPMLLVGVFIWHKSVCVCVKFELKSQTITDTTEFDI